MLGVPEKKVSKIKSYKIFISNKIKKTASIKVALELSFPCEDSYFRTKERTIFFQVLKENCMKKKK